MQDIENLDTFVECLAPDCGVLVPPVSAPQEPLCHAHIELLFRRVCEFDAGPAQDEAMADVRRRVLGLE